jgi:endonuclease III
MNIIINKSRIKKIAKVLYKVYGDSNLGNKEDPLDELIFIVLTTKTSEKIYSTTYSALLRKYENWENVRKASVEEIAEVIKPGGLYKQKAILINEILQSIYEKNKGVLDLTFLRKMTDIEAEKYLLSLRGVGVKSAKCVLLYSLHRNVLPVDTHTYRLAFELGLIPQTYMRNEKGKLHKHLESLIPPECRYQFHVGAVMHGRLEHNSRQPFGNCIFLGLLARYGLVEL